MIDEGFVKQEIIENSDESVEKLKEEEKVKEDSDEVKEEDLKEHVIEEHTEDDVKQDTSENIGDIVDNELKEKDESFDTEAVSVKVDSNAVNVSEKESESAEEKSLEVSAGEAEEKNVETIEFIDEELEVSEN